MKTIIVFMLFLVGTFCAYSQNYNQEQETLRTEISNYLNRQGLNPENQKDGLKFKSEGDVYYIEIDESERNPMYVRLRRYVKYEEKYDKNEIAKKLNDYNVKFGVKVFCQEKSVVFSSEMYVKKASEFTYAFDTFLRHMKGAYELINE